jgi:hypothetical protein
VCGCMRACICEHACARVRGYGRFAGASCVRHGESDPTKDEGSATFEMQGKTFNDQKLFNDHVWVGA